MALVGKGFSKYLNTLFNDPELSDVAIVLDNDEGDGTSAETKTFHGHRVILATVSDYFRSMLYGSFVEATKKEIRLPGVPYSVGKGIF
ncbi:kelch repeat and BTB domain-containing protein 8 [Culex quinquefasciatus]|uniref:kelch repeat and BTB domain-containing protein 8 n=1 Tax=Culex quinquefasciatus TaxID=7176 RepID=UPI0018E3479A|nr:kelch repeat and BTB domain-containing protein 8 [Culex quinquefasciatus]